MTTTPEDEFLIAARQRGHNIAAFASAVTSDHVPQTDEHRALLDFGILCGIAAATEELKDRGRLRGSR